MNLVAADVRRFIPFRAKEVRASLRRLLRFRGSRRAHRSGNSLPEGEGGESSPVGSQSERARLGSDRMPFSLSLREPAGVRGFPVRHVPMLIPTWY